MSSGSGRSSKGGSSKSSYNYTYTPTQTQTPTPEKTQSTYTDPLQKGLTDLGLGLVYNPNLITELRLKGAIYEDNGTLKWANGWNANNYRAKLN